MGIETIGGEMDKLFRILSIDGGGIRGIFPAQILKRIKDEIGIEFSRELDLIAGTSTGAIIAAGLAVDYPADKIVHLYQMKGAKIFRRNYSDKFNWCNWKMLKNCKYSNLYLKKVLGDVFQDLTLSETNTRLIILSSDISNGNVFVFKSNYDPGFVRDKNIKLAEAVLASCSVPLFFNPIKVNEYLLADGGLWANNPTLVSLVEALGPRLFIKKENIRILSLGTGLAKEYYDPKDIDKNWGFLKWGVGLVSTSMNLQSINVDNIVRFIVGDDKYLRINFCTDSEVHMDDIDIVENLISRADEQFTYSFEKIKRFFKED